MPTGPVAAHEAEKADEAPGIGRSASMLSINLLSGHCDRIGAGTVLPSQHDSAYSCNEILPAVIPWPKSVASSFLALSSSTKYSIDLLFFSRTDAVQDLGWLDG